MGSKWLAGAWREGVHSAPPSLRGPGGTGAEEGLVESSPRATAELRLGRAVVALARVESRDWARPQPVVG
eukprot:scaffold12071_cov101-Isochrysis_galbana.AAC.1